MQMHYNSYGTSRHMTRRLFVRPLTIEGLCECRGDTPSIAQWVADVRQPSQHSKVQSLRDGFFYIISVSDSCGLFVNFGVHRRKTIENPAVNNSSSEVNGKYMHQDGDFVNKITLFVRPLTIEGLCECRGDTPSIAQWVADVRQPSQHSKVQSLRDGFFYIISVSDSCGLFVNFGVHRRKTIENPAVNNSSSEVNGKYMHQDGDFVRKRWQAKMHC
ncbi:hypothetical protein CSKR_109849 [Clonorchis sinensis]|uniref:Uncharacterized protein n=1 Tax=Clonorchis sinensis TaxID=79923 RepID=A0A3R7EZ01_CLOSI|nr:hypothetical protein CSKR_109849 [Clonorchis sinensis]